MIILVCSSLDFLHACLLCCLSACLHDYLFLCYFLRHLLSCLLASLIENVLTWSIHDLIASLNFAHLITHLPTGCLVCLLALISFLFSSLPTVIDCLGPASPYNRYTALTDVIVLQDRLCTHGISTCATKTSELDEQLLEPVECRLTQRVWPHLAGWP